MKDETIEIVRNPTEKFELFLIVVGKLLDKFECGYAIRFRKIILILV